MTTLKLIDSHCHLEKFQQKGTLPEILNNCEEAGIEQLIAVGTHIGDWPTYNKLAKAHLGKIFWTAGIHPCHVEEDWRDQAMAIMPWFTDACPPVALGEIGLDYFHLPKEESAIAEQIARQKAAFRHQLSFAYQLDCPIVIHSRNAFSDCVALIDESGVNWEKVVFHCFSEGPEEIKTLNERGGRGSFTGIITYPSAENVREAALQQGLDRLMIETDAPYLAPVPHRGKPCEPAFTRNTAEYCASLLGVPFETLAQKSYENTQAFYGLG